MRCIANIFNFEYAKLIFTMLLLTLVLSSCSSNSKDKGDNRHTEKREIAPLGEGQSVNDLYPTKNDSKQEVLVVNNFVISPEFPSGATPVSSCQFLILEVASASYVQSSNAIDFYSTTLTQFSKLQLNSNFLGGVVAYNSELTVNTNSSTNKAYLQIPQEDLSSLDVSNKTYYPLSICGSSIGNIYSDFNVTNNLSVSRDGNISNTTLRFILPAKRIVEQAQPNPSASLFTVNITFASGVTIPQDACQYVILQTPKTGYNQASKLPKLFTTSLTSMRGLSASAPNNNFLDGTVVYADSNETLLQDPTGQIYVSANVANTDLTSSNYLPVIVCKENVYSDFEHTTSFISSDGLNIDVNNITITRPVVTLQPQDDVQFGDKTHNAATPNAAFNENDSRFNFVLDLGNLPDPVNVMNGACDYSAAIDYSTALTSHSTLQLPTTIADFESLYPGGSFGNSEAKGVLAIVKNPPVHAGSTSGYYIGMRISLPKPVQNYVNVAYCTLGGRNSFAGYALTNDTTFNHDIAQIMHFDVKYNFPNSKGLNLTDYSNPQNSNSAGHIQLVLDNTFTKSDFDDIVRNGCSGYYAIVGTKGHLSSAFGLNGYNSISNASVLYSSLDSAHGNDWQYVYWPAANSTDLRISTDYKNLFLNFIGNTDGHYNSLTSGTDTYTYVMVCDFGSGKIMSDLSRPAHISITQGAGNSIVISPSPVLLNVTRAN